MLDMNDRSLRNVIVGLGGKPDGFVRQTGFDITVASEIMAILCLATSVSDLKERLSRMVVAYNKSWRSGYSWRFRSYWCNGIIIKGCHPTKPSSNS